MLTLKLFISKNYFSWREDWTDNLSVLHSQQPCIFLPPKFRAKGWEECGEGVKVSFLISPCFKSARKSLLFYWPFSKNFSVVLFIFSHCFPSSLYISAPYFLLQKWHLSHTTSARYVQLSHLVILKIRRVYPLFFMRGLRFKIVVLMSYDKWWWFFKQSSLWKKMVGQWTALFLIQGRVLFGLASREPTIFLAFHYQYLVWTSHTDMNSYL